LAQAVQVFSVDCPVIAVITMVRLITAFACALVANADYICTTAPAVFAVDCQCLSMVQDNIDGHRLLSLPPGALYAPPHPDGQSGFTINAGRGGGLAYENYGGQELCVTRPDEESPGRPFPGLPVIDSAPCDYYSDGGIFIALTTGQLYHVGKSQTNQTRECLEPNLVPGHVDWITVGECSSTWTISSTPSCSSKSEMVIS